MEVDGPPRMVGWITWSGRERSSQTQFLPVPGVWLIHPSPSFKIRNLEDFYHPQNLPHPSDQNQNQDGIAINHKPKVTVTLVNTFQC